MILTIDYSGCHHPTLVISDTDNGNGPPACLHRKPCLGCETETVFGVALILQTTCKTIITCDSMPEWTNKIAFSVLRMVFDYNMYLLTIQ